MVAARVAGVPNPRSFIASSNSRSSNVFPVVSMAVSSEASVKRFGGLVFCDIHRGDASLPRCKPGRQFFRCLRVLIVAFILLDLRFFGLVLQTAVQGFSNPSG